MIKKVINIFVIFIGFVLLGVFAAVIGLKLAFPDEKLKTLAKDGIRGFIARESSFGKIHIGVSGLEIENFDLSNLTDFKDGTLLSAKKIVLKPGFFSGTASGKLVIDSPKIYITANSADSWNISDISAQLLNKEIPKGHRYNYLPIFTIIKVNNGEIVFSGEKHSLPDIEVKKIFLDISGLNPESGLKTGLKAYILVSGNELELNAELAYNVFNHSANLRKLVIKQGNQMVTVSGNLRQCFMKGKDIEYDFNVTGDRTVFDAIVEIISKDSNIQFGDKDKINFELSGIAGIFKVSNH